VTSSLNLKPVTLEDWLNKLEDRTELLEDVDKNPAIKLADFYRKAGTASTPRWMMTWRAAQASKTLREIGPVNPQWMSRWLKQWGLV
jgi:hypothetical protein